MNRRTAIKAMLGGGVGMMGGGCKVRSSKPLTFAEKMDLIGSIKMTETGYNFRNIPIGANGEQGPLQITEQYVDDCNRIIGEEKFDYYMRGRMPMCRSMMLVYWDHYATFERLGHEPTLEDLARIHNGGPDGWRKDSTIGYWKKIERELKKGA